MIKLSVSEDYNKLVAVAAEIAPRHIPRSTVVALSKTGVKAKNAIIAEMPRAFDRPTSWTLNGVFLKPATFADPAAEIMIKDFAPKGTPAIKYLAPGIYGGGRNVKRFERALQAAGAMPRGWYAVPTKDVKLDAFGNPPGSLITQILSAVRASPDPMQNRTEASKKRSRGRQRDYFVITQKRGKLVPGIYERRQFGQGTGTRMLFVYTPKQPTYQQRLDFFGIVETTVQREFAMQFEFAFEDALRRFGM